MRYIEIGLAIAGVILGIASPLFREMIEPRTGCLPPVPVHPVSSKRYERGALFAAIPRLYTYLESITSKQVMAMIDDGCDVHGEPGEPPLVVALGEGGTVEIIEAILAMGADIDALGIAFYECSVRKDSTALMVAADRGMLDETRLLLARGAAVDRKSSKGETALMAAVGAFYDHDNGLKLVRLLFEKGADPLVRDAGGNTLLHLAAMNNLQYLRLLLDRGADVNARNDKGETPLHLTVKGSYYNEDTLPYVRLLLQRGAIAQVRDASGRTAFDVAKKNGLVSVARLLPRESERTAYGSVAGAAK